MSGCNNDTPGGLTEPDPNDPIDLTTIEYNPTAFEIMLPEGYPRYAIPDDNPTTTEGINLGRHLFYDPILSADSTMSCSSCHFPNLSFTDGRAFSPGIDGIEGNRSSMSLLNIGLNYRGLFWDGRVRTLEEQALIPVEDPIELHNTWTNVVQKLQNDEEYAKLFRKAFGISDVSEITKELAAKAIAQFERIIVSGGNSKYQRVKWGNLNFTDQEKLGEDLFIDSGDEDTVDAECSHCHNGPLFMGDEFFNNGLDNPNQLTDLGRQGITGNLIDRGKFKAPTLINVMLTAPYMHDGRFATIEQVIGHYNTGGKPAPNKDANLRELELSQEDKDALIAFLETLTDTTYMYPDLVRSPF